MLDEITEYMVSGKLQEMFMADGEYLACGRRQKEVAVRCYQSVPAEYHPLVEELMECQNTGFGRLIHLAYRQGLTDGVRLLSEMNERTGNKT